MSRVQVAAAAAVAGLAALGVLILRSGERLTWSELFGLAPRSAPIRGEVKPGYEPVREAFEANFAKGVEIGASFAAFVDGECVADLVGGWKDPGRTAEFDTTTVAPVFSCGKAVMAIIVAKLVSEGRLRYEDRVADIWPEFAAGSKDRVTVSDVLAHVGGVSWLDPEFRPSPEELRDLDALAKKIAAAPHNWGGERKATYSAAVGGFFLNEVVRRVDPKGRSCSAILKEDILPLLDGGDRPAEIYCGLPEDFDHSRLATVKVYNPLRLLARMLTPGFISGCPLPSEYYQILFDRGTLKALTSIPRFKEQKDMFLGEASSYNMVSNARSLASLASLMSLGGSPLVGAETLSAALADLEPSPTVVLGRQMAVGGFGKLQKKAPVVFSDFPNPIDERYCWYGWHGAGGAVLQWNPALKIGVAYVMNGMNPLFGGDSRGGACAKAVVECAEALRGGK
ncbi:beta-lactamase/transpeptidase-like protein [Hyaloraphidium curvatum]|nr:beta-lactamase/transpeptidase-like protein [Hyaloraphidium curvatum]